MKKVTNAFLVVLVLGATTFFVWLRDLRLTHPRAVLTRQIEDREFAITRMRDQVDMMVEYKESDSPLETRLAEKVRREYVKKLELSPEDITDEHFSRWFALKKKSLEEAIETDLQVLPANIKQYEAEIEKLRADLRDVGSPWLFHRE